MPVQAYGARFVASTLSFVGKAEIDGTAVRRRVVRWKERKCIVPVGGDERRIGE